MGMFDWVECEYPLPDGGPKSDDGYQTKDFDNYLWHYQITAEGRLFRRDQWSMKEQEELGSEPPEKWTDQNYHGVFWFYTSDEETDEWFEYEARFTDGQLVGIERVELERAE
mgnify:CR=1 FL=1